MKIIIMIIYMLISLNAGMDRDVNNKNEIIMDESTIRRYVKSTFYEEQVISVENLNNETIQDYGERGYGIPSELIRYCIDSLLENNVEESLNAVMTEYMVEVKENGDEIWYYADLAAGKEKDGKDLVICREEDGKQILYYYENIAGWSKCYELAGKGGGQVYSTPYFIEWNEQTFMVVPYWDDTNEKIVGLVIYDFSWYYKALTIGIRNDFEITISGQEYWTNYGDRRSTEYPVVYWE